MSRRSHVAVLFAALCVVGCGQMAGSSDRGGTPRERAGLNGAEPRVYVYAALTTLPPQEPTPETIKFNNVGANVNEMYDSATGVFTAGWRMNIRVKASMQWPGSTSHTHVESCNLVLDIDGFRPVPVFSAAQPPGDPCYATSLVRITLERGQQLRVLGWNTRDVELAELPYPYGRLSILEER